MADRRDGGRLAPEHPVSEHLIDVQLDTVGDGAAVSKDEDGSLEELSAPDIHVVPDTTLASGDALVDKLRKRLQKVPPAAKAGGSRICRIPPDIRTAENEAYEPRIVSIGPLHRDKPNLTPMEDIKWAYLRDLLARSPLNDLNKYVTVIRRRLEDARAQYAEDVCPPSDDELVEILVLDGCFIIEYLLKRVFKQTKDTDALAGVRWGFSHLRRDLMLFENQIPFFVLVELSENSEFPFEGTRKAPLTLMELTMAFLRIKLPKEKWPKVGKVLHLLHLYHFCLDPHSISGPPSFPCSTGQILRWPFKKMYDFISLLFFGLIYIVLMWELPPFILPSKKKCETPRMINCATELVEAGVRFKRKDVDKLEKVGCFLKVSFTEGVMEIPFLMVESSTSSKLRNLIALEQCCPVVGSYFTSYAVLMDNIINTERDVAILRAANIIESKLGSDKEVAGMFNGLCRGTHMKYEEHYNAGLFKDVKAYCEFAHHQWRATLVHKFFGSPWSIVSLLAGLLLLLLTATQTLFTMFPRK